MTKKIRPAKETDVTAYLRRLFLKTEQELIREIKRKRSAGYVDYAEAAALERVQKILQDMVDESWEYIPEMIETILPFRQGCSRLCQCQDAHSGPDGRCTAAIQ